MCVVRKNAISCLSSQEAFLCSTEPLTAILPACCGRLMKGAARPVVWSVMALSVAFCSTHKPSALGQMLLFVSSCTLESSADPKQVRVDTADQESNSSKFLNTSSIRLKVGTFECNSLATYKHGGVRRIRPLEGYPARTVVRCFRRCQST